jgi:hypothetical protein
MFAEIRTLRHGLWTHVASRKHTATKVFFGGEDELMLYGTVKYVLKSDPEAEVEVQWAGRVVFDFTEGVRMRFYQVYLVSSFQSFVSMWGIWRGGGRVCGSNCGANSVLYRIRLLSQERNSVWGFFRDMPWGI